MSIKDDLAAGRNLFLCSNYDFYNPFIEIIKKDDSHLKLAQQSAKRILYSLSNSSNMNLADFGKPNSYWMIMFILIASISCLICLAFFILFLLKIRQKKTIE